MNHTGSTDKRIKNSGRVHSDSNIKSTQETSSNRKHIRPF